MARLYRSLNIKKMVAVGLRVKTMIKKLLSKLKRVKMTDYDLGVLHASEGKMPTKETNLYKMGYTQWKLHFDKSPTSYHT